jgi:hypothetical protein
VTRDDIIRMAREAEMSPSAEGLYWTATPGDLELFAALVAAAERDACAKVCDAVAQQMDDEGEGPTGNIGWVIGCAESIRARGQA